MNSGFHILLRLTLILAFAVVVLGAYVRLSDAGLGCPDWPGCYGRLAVPQGTQAIENANFAFPQRPLETAKAWKEMAHRYLAGILGLLIFALAVIAWRRRGNPGQPVALPLVLAALVIFQALLGMWTVTLQLKPVIVLAHLLGGLAMLSLLWWMALSSSRLRAGQAGGLEVWRPWALAGLAILLAQIMLGGWTSANYAALACPDFPTCQAQWWPEMDFSEAFVLWRGLGVDYEFGVLESPARTAIHVAHRIGALLTAGYLAALTAALLANAGNRVAVRHLSIAILALLIAQVSLGISNVVFHLPLPVAVAHNAAAALLLMALLALVYVLPSSASGQPARVLQES